MGFSQAGQFHVNSQNQIIFMNRNSPFNTMKKFFLNIWSVRLKKLTLQYDVEKYPGIFSLRVTEP